jgi:hypothetical protein
MLEVLMGILLLVADICVIWLVVWAVMNTPKKLSELECAVSCMLIIMSSIPINWLTITHILQLS